MTDSFHSAWLELALAGLATSIVTSWRLSSVQAPERCAPALAREERAAILRGTCDASESGWARVVRAELDADLRVNLEGAYRDAPRREPSPSAARVFREERARIRLSFALALAGVVAAFAGACALIRAQPIVMIVIALVAARTAWTSLERSRAATSALASALDAASRFGADVRAPFASGAAHDVDWLRVKGPGCMGFALLGLILSPIAAMLVAETTAPVSASKIGLLAFVHVFVAPVVFAVAVLLRSASVSLDAARREVRVVRHILGVPYARTTVPLEIVTGFAAEEKKGGRFKTLFLVAKTREDSLELVSGDAAAAAATALSRARG